MNDALFEKYSNLDFEIKQLEEQKTMLRSEILDELKQNDVVKQETKYGVFTTASRKSYEYTETVKKLEEKVKLQKVKEEQKGSAKLKLTEYLVFNAPKV